MEQPHAGTACWDITVARDATKNGKNMEKKMFCLKICDNKHVFVVFFGGEGEDYQHNILEVEMILH